MKYRSAIPPFPLKTISKLTGDPSIVISVYGSKFDKLSRDTEMSLLLLGILNTIG
jgi:hypothetical protein